MKIERRGFLGRLLCLPFVDRVSEKVLPFFEWRNHSFTVQPPSIDYDDLMTTTLNLYSPAAVDRIMKSNSLYRWLTRHRPPVHHEEQTSFDWHQPVPPDEDLRDEEDFYD